MVEHTTSNEWSEGEANYRATFPSAACGAHARRETLAMTLGGAMTLIRLSPKAIWSGDEEDAGRPSKMKLRKVGNGAITGFPV